jgi:1-acyl-sn-glycerol-3-phosphate acyltransferase
MALDRQDAAGFREFVKQGRGLLEKGASLCIFPEGTRCMDGKLADFKKGAFTIATKAKVCLRMHACLQLQRHVCCTVHCASNKPALQGRHAYSRSLASLHLCTMHCVVTECMALPRTHEYHSYCSGSMHAEQGALGAGAMHAEIVHSVHGCHACGWLQVPLVPVTILGSGDVMPSGREGELHKGDIRVIVHPPIPTRGKKTSAAADECRAAIASRLPGWKLA